MVEDAKEERSAGQRQPGGNPSVAPEADSSTQAQPGAVQADGSEYAAVASSAEAVSPTEAPPTATRAGESKGVAVASSAEGAAALTETPPPGLVTALGELLIDFTPGGLSPQGQPLFERNPGGAPANVLAALAKLGCRTSFVGAVGDDAFGHYLSEVLALNGIGVEGLKFLSEAQTTLAFVHLDATGDRSFTFYRKPGADHLLRVQDLPLATIEASRIFHFGSISMTHEPSLTATLGAAVYARDKGVLVTYDPNLRLSLWPDAELAKARIIEGLKLADVVKLSEEELLFLTGEEDLERGTAQLLEKYPLSLIFVTLGGAGSYARSREGSAAHNGYRVDVVDTTGAGDAFFGGVLYQLLGNTDHVWSTDWLVSVLAFANAMGALAATGKGAIPSMPSAEQIEALMRAGERA